MPLIADPIRRTAKGDRLAVTGRSLRCAVGARESTEQRVEGSVLLDHEDDVLDLRARQVDRLVGGPGNR